MEETNALSILSQVNHGPYCSFIPSTLEEKKALYNAMTRPEHRFSDCLNMTVDVHNCYIEEVEMVNGDTGEAQKIPRVVLIDGNNEGYVAISRGVYRDFVRVCQVFGMPPWNDGVRLKFVQNQLKDRRVYGLQIE